MKEWSDKHDLLERMAQARRDARETVPKSGGNDVVEAAMTYAAIVAASEYRAEQVAKEQAVADESPGTTDEPPQPAAPPVTAPKARLPEVNYGDQSG